MFVLFRCGHTAPAAHHAWRANAGASTSGITSASGRLLGTLVVESTTKKFQVSKFVIGL